MAALLLSVTGVTSATGLRAWAGPIAGGQAGWVAQKKEARPSLSGRQGNYTASVFVAASAQRAWSVLTGYEAMAGVMPDIKEASVVRRNGSLVELQQTYQAPYTFGRRIKATLAMRESAPRQLSYDLIRGEQIRRLSGSWTITPVSGGVLLRHQISVDPVIPSLIRPLYYELTEANLVQSMRILKRLMEQS